MGEIEHRHGWDGVGEDRIDAGGAHLPKISTDGGELGKELASRVGREGAVRHAADPEALVADPQELAIHDRSLGAHETIVTSSTFFACAASVCSGKTKAASRCGAMRVVGL